MIFFFILLVPLSFTLLTLTQQLFANHWQWKPLEILENLAPCLSAGEIGRALKILERV